MDGQPWFDKAIRDHTDEHGPSGGAWNISMILERLHGAAPKPLPIDEGLVERVARAIDDVTRATIERDIPTHQRGQVVADSRALARAAIEVMLGEK